MDLQLRRQERARARGVVLRLRISEGRRIYGRGVGNARHRHALYVGAPVSCEETLAVTYAKAPGSAGRVLLSCIVHPRSSSSPATAQTCSKFEYQRNARRQVIASIRDPFTRKSPYVNTVLRAGANGCAFSTSTAVTHILHSSFVNIEICPNLMRRNSFCMLRAYA